MGAPGSVDEVEIDIYRLPVATRPADDLALHQVEVEGPVPVLAPSPPRVRTRQRRHVQFGLDPGGDHLGHLLMASREAATADQKGVRRKSGPYMGSADLGYHAACRDDLAGRQNTAGDQHIVELQILILAHRYVPQQRRNVRCARDHPDGYLTTGLMGAGKRSPLRLRRIDVAERATSDLAETAPYAFPPRICQPGPEGVTAVGDLPPILSTRRSISDSHAFEDKHCL